MKNTIENLAKAFIGESQARDRYTFHAKIEVTADGKSYRKFLKPGDAPEAEFYIEGENIGAREHCNIHGL